MGTHREIALKNTSRFLCLLASFYMVLPGFISLFLPDSFYVFYQNSSDGIFESVIFFFIFVGIFFSLGAIDSDSYITSNINMVQIFKIFHGLHILYLVIVLFIGLRVRMLVGASRPELLELISSFFFPGYSYLLAASVCYMVIRASGRYLLMVGLFFLLLDFAYMGKIFTLLILVTWMMWADYNRKSGKIFFTGILIGGVIAVAIFLIREFVVKSSVGGLSLYLFFSEFIGVFATIGWAEAYHAQGLPGQLLNFNEVLEPFYTKLISHGLALHPAAYFVGNFGDYWALAAAVYAVVLCLFSYFAARMLGFLYVVIFIVNSVHFFRHGPDVFAKNLIVQSLFFCAILFMAKIFNILAKANAAEKHSAKH